MSEVFKYRILVQVRTDLTAEEIAKREATATTPSGPKGWPYRDTGEVIHARRASTASAFYRALRQIKPIIKIRAVRLPLEKSSHLRNHELMRAWVGFACLSGIVSHGGIDVGDEVKHFAVSSGLTACGIRFVSAWTTGGKPECDKCLAAAIEQHPEMKQYL